MKDGSYDKEIAELMQLSGDIMLRYNALNAGLSAYVAKCQTGQHSVKQVYKILNKKGRNGKPPYRFTHFVACLKQNGELSIPENDLLLMLDRMRVIRNSIAHWMLGRAADGTFGIVSSVTKITVDIKSMYDEFISIYGKINDIILKVMT